MIQANELRIGNWVYWERSTGEKTAEQVDLFDPSEINENPIKWYEPIPLTPELLEKCGFVKYDGTIDCWCKEYKNNEFDLLRNPAGLYYACKTNLNGIEYIYGRGINYLHQLQNLYFALTNQELQIEL